MNNPQRRTVYGKKVKMPDLPDLIAREVMNDVAKNIDSWVTKENRLDIKITKNSEIK